MRNYLLILLTATLIPMTIQALDSPHGDPYKLLGGDGPYPYGELVEFPWDKFEGCWASLQDPNVYVVAKRREVQGQRFVDLQVKTENMMALGVGNLRNNLVTAFMSAVDMQGEREIFLANFGQYCVKTGGKDSSACYETMGLSIVREKDSVTTQSDHVLERVTDDNQFKN